MRGFFISVILLLAIQSNSQTNVLPGKIYAADGSSREVYFHLTPLDETPQAFAYSLSKEGTLTTLRPGEAQRVELENGRVYESRHISVAVINKDDAERFRAEYFDSTRTVTGVRFVERILQGKISLYQFIDKYNYPHFFYQGATDTAVTLLQKRSYLGEGYAIVTEALYRNQISMLAQQQNCSSVQNSLEALPYKPVPLSAVFVKLNECMGERVNASAFLNNTRIELTYGAAGGVVRSTARDQSFNASVSPTFGGYVELVPGKNVKNFRFLGELLYNSYQIKTGPEEYNSFRMIVGKIIELNPLINLFVTRNNNPLFLEFGGNMQFVIQHDRITEQKLVTNQIHRVVRPKPNSLLLGVMGGVGYRNQQFTLLLRHKTAIIRNFAEVNQWVLMARYALKRSAKKQGS